MATQNWCILTAAQFATAQTLDDDEEYMIGERPVDNPSPGVGINLNPDATDYPDGGEVVTLVGKYVCPKRMIDDPACLQYAPLLRDLLLTVPWAMLESETIFVPLIGA